jgi:type II secretory pathway pseudopilin PulG
MNKRILFVLAIVLAAAGFYFQAQAAKVADTKKAQIVQADVAGGSYDRAAKAATASTGQPDTGQIYADAQRACSGKTDSVTQARCNQQYIQAHTSSLPSPSPVPQPKLAEYQHRVSAPLWTPDITGVLFLGALASAGAGLFAIWRQR